MSWGLSFLPEAMKDLNSLGKSQQILVLKSIEKVRTNPLPASEGGYGKPLGNKGGKNLTGLLKIKLRGAGIRVVYKLIRTETQMLVVVVGFRSDDEVYDTADNRVKKHEL